MLSSASTLGNNLGGFSSFFSSVGGGLSKGFNFLGGKSGDDEDDNQSGQSAQSITSLVGNLFGSQKQVTAQQARPSAPLSLPPLQLPNPPAASSNNTMLYIALGFVAILIVSKR